MSCGAGCRCGSDPVLLWLWCGPAATALIRPLAWEPAYAAGAALEKAKRQKKKKKKKKKERKKEKKQMKIPESVAIESELLLRPRLKVLSVWDPNCSVSNSLRHRKRVLRSRPVLKMPFFASCCVFRVSFRGTPPAISNYKGIV